MTKKEMLEKVEELKLKDCRFFETPQHDSNDVIISVFEASEIFEANYTEDISDPCIEIEKNAIECIDGSEIVVGDVAVLTDENTMKIPEKYRDSITNNPNEFQEIAGDMGVSPEELAKEWGLEIENPKDDWETREFVEYWDGSNWILEEISEDENPIAYKEIDKERVIELIENDMVESLKI